MKINVRGAIVGLVVGVGVGVCLETVNGVLTFLVPPVLVILPVCVAVGVVVGGREGRGQGE